MTEMAKKIYRSRSDRMVWGVCGGLGKYFKLDSTIFRALFLLLVLINGIGIALYVFLAIIIPNEPGKEATEEVAKKTEGTSGEEKIKTEISN